jgi:hypothetical protein
LLSQDDPTALPPLINRPPRIIEEQAVVNGSAARELTINVNVDCNASLEFSAPVEDPDIDDQLVARLFVDYSPVSDLSQAQPPFRESVLVNQGSPVRIARFDAIKPWAEGSPFKTVGTHVVDLLVTDGRIGYPGQAPPPDPVEGYDAGDPRYSVTHTWVIDSVDLPCGDTTP